MFAQKALPEHCCVAHGVGSTAGARKVADIITRWQILGNLGTMTMVFVSGVYWDYVVLLKTSVAKSKEYLEQAVVWQGCDQRLPRMLLGVGWV